jgi:manganese oxidase
MQADLHTSHWHGNVVSWNGHNTDVIDLLPASFRTVYMQPDAAGVWPIHCKHVAKMLL